MASEHPRRHVWSADPHSSLTWLVSVGQEGHIALPNFYLIKSPTPIAAIAVAAGERLPISDDWDNLVVICRPLREHEVVKVNIKDGEVVKLDAESYTHLTEKDDD